MGNLFRGFCCHDDDILWFLILFLLLFWNGCGCNNYNNCGCNNENDCGCNTLGTNNCNNGCGC